MTKNSVYWIWVNPARGIVSYLYASPKSSDIAVVHFVVSIGSSVQICFVEPDLVIYLPMSVIGQKASRSSVVVHQ